ncbi:S-adenosyl methyltransferase [Saccharopolyspora erythraea NRRL 2338]|uniref:Uncharacterized protein n=2 Tax=Saccharopolyspora erythraea TaxID=1836 RepID=A4FGP6_SACEN|nr:SAM-dependent methyltransferase [Saccharopolyspora erythraea]EQD85614.1 SAM-dependent methyltransferase [Saccharopolyspora erythraea D]PFG96925.1 S-adenosyl methyltransferase [Saccharopolyspora erythraea NRRL 2338]QRK87151.1 SAM-dependent methyltransferase [Saccharopolyspora erythraea]CAM03221.1 hypothetical protein SACE_3950 [Saccharopolyspora erythraea NRRL 2338]
MAHAAGRPSSDDFLPIAILHTEQAHSARLYDYILGGKDNYTADRVAAHKLLRAWPGVKDSMLANRAFMHRVATFLAQEAGIRQFLDIGTGIPISPNLHEVVQRTAPDARIVYVDNDPIVLTHARALLTGAPQGRTAYVEADMRRPETILTAPAFTDTLDLSEPIALTVIAMVHLIADEDAFPLVDRLVQALPSGSYLALSTSTADTAPEMHEVARLSREEGIDLQLRSKEKVEEFFQGMELVEPGVQLINRWRPGTEVVEADIAMYGGVARKP